MKKTYVVVVLLILALSVSACGPLADVERPQECKFLEPKARCIVRLQQESNNEEVEVITEPNSDPVDPDGLIIQIDGYGDQGAYGDPVVGRKIVVRDDLEANENGWFTREVVEVHSLSELSIPEMDVPFMVEFERDYSQARRAWQPYFSINVDPTVSRKEIEKFLLDHSEIVATSVVIKIDSEGMQQECSLKGLDPLAVRHVLYSGNGITFQMCDPNWSTP